MPGTGQQGRLTLELGQWEAGQGPDVVRQDPRQKLLWKGSRGDRAQEPGTQMTGERWELRYGLGRG